MNNLYDIVIVGAGISGLCAARELREKNFLILEKMEHPGGRILTRYHGEIAYDVGAIFGYRESHLNFLLPSSELIAEKNDIGLFYTGKVHYGSRIEECLSKVGLTKEELEQVKQFSSQLDLNLLSPKIYKILNAFFQVIHPGEMKEYISERFRDSFIRFASHHHKNGNGELIQYLTDLVGDRMRLDAEVLSVEERGDRVYIEYISQEKKYSLQAKSVLLTVPAPIAYKLLVTMNKEARNFLHSVRYARGSIVVLALPNHLICDFSYIVTVGASPNTVIRQNKGDICLLSCYYVGEQAQEILNLPDNEVITKTINHLNALGIGTLSQEKLNFTDIKHWPLIGPIISEEFIANQNLQAIRPSERVFLAGDYTLNTKLPYGMVAAMNSGNKAVALIQAFLNQTLTSNYFSWATEPLTDAYLYKITQNKPIFVGRKAEGTVAYYGLILQAEYDESLRDYLLENRRDFLWEYHQGYGVTAEDSTLVLEGLLEAKVSHEILLPSLQRLVELFFEDKSGAFHTIPFNRPGRAKYWLGPSPDATAHAGYLLHRVTPILYQKEIEACCRFLQVNQQEDGGFQGRWFPSRMITTYYALRLLHRMNCSVAVERAKCFVLNQQKKNGSWQDSVIDTATAILALRTINPDEPVIDRGKKWLVEQKSSNGWCPEAVLYYWFETEENERLFFHGVDRGKITTAWAMLALAD